MSSNCRCRLCSPAAEYAEAFKPAQQLLTMAALGGQLLSITVSIDYGQALAALLRVRQLWPLRGPPDDGSSAFLLAQ